MAPLADLAAYVLSRVVPAVVRRVHPIPVYRNGDDSESRTASLQCLLQSQVLVIAPGAGDSRQRNADGLRPLTFGVASIARRYFEATAEALAVIPLAIIAPGRGLGSQVTTRVGEPFYGMSDSEYPQLFLSRGDIEEAAKQRAYQLYTQQLAARITELLRGPGR
jgi:1-acyl-sn-glycerol-3-phosphate acyltransferase